VKTSRKLSKLFFAAAALPAFAPSPLFACAACYGKSDSALASGMNWGIFTLMGVIVTVLASIAGFFVYIIRKEAALAAKAAAENLPAVKA
jgi:heme/copper-type cytochrome/quinol oxidase subunit 2